MINFQPLYLFIIIFAVWIIFLNYFNLEYFSNIKLRLDSGGDNQTNPGGIQRNKVSDKFPITINISTNTPDNDTPDNDTPQVYMPIYSPWRSYYPLQQFYNSFGQFYNPYYFYNPYL